MQFKTLTVEAAPKPARAGGFASVFSADDITAAITILNKPEAISDGDAYPDAKKARNRAGVLRSRIKKVEGSPKTRIAVVNEGSDKAPKFHWWIVPVKA